jgi:CRISPR-associated endonuclease Csn1
MLERLPIREDWVLGVDLGIGSCGIALVQLGEEPRILFMGSRCFEVPEFPKDKKLKNAVRRSNRLSRRVLRRRSRRMQEIRELFVRHALLPSADPEAVHNRKGVKATAPYAFRANGLERPLSELEFAIALLHIAKHRGFKSTKKTEFGVNVPPGKETAEPKNAHGGRPSKTRKSDVEDAVGEKEENTQKMLAALAANQELVARYETDGQMLYRDAKFDDKKRNSDGDYRRTLGRSDLEAECKKTFRAAEETGERLGQRRA